MTDLADTMVKNCGLSFSAAKRITGRLVVIAHDENISIDDIDSALVARAAREALDIDLHMSEEWIKHALDPVENVKRRSVPGGPSPERVQEMIDDGYNKLDDFKADWTEKKAKLNQAAGDLFNLANAVIKEELK